jgi:large subunit ribosomal protein L17
MLSNLAVSILDKERVATTLAKAKEVRGVVERMITYGKKGDLHARRLAACRINNDAVLKKLFGDIAPGYKDRNGGYTRVLKTEDRKGDCAPMAIIELVGRGHNDAVRKKGGAAKKKAAKPKAAASLPASAVDSAAKSQVEEPVETAGTDAGSNGKVD